MSFQGFDYQVTYNKYNLFFTKFITPYSYEEIVSELKKESWVPFSNIDTTGNSEGHWPLRFKLMQPKSLLLQRIHNFFSSSDLRRSVIDQLYCLDLKNLYGQTKDTLFKNTLFHGEFTLDKPGFECGRHIDYRLLVATGGIYLSEKDDENISTYFYTDNKKDTEPHTRATTNYGDGWLQVNGNDVWHDGWNRSNSDRFSMLTALTLNLRFND